MYCFKFYQKFIWSPCERNSFVKKHTSQSSKKGLLESKSPYFHNKRPQTKMKCNYALYARAADPLFRKEGEFLIRKDLKTVDLRTSR